MIYYKLHMYKMRVPYMKKLIKNFMTILLLGLILLFNPMYDVSAEEYCNDVTESSINGVASYSGVNLPTCYSPGDTLGRTNWPSLAAAKNYYGTDFTYYSCGGGGFPYTHYYCFSDGSKMFFGVL